MPWRTRARWIDRFAPAPSILLLMPVLLLVAYDAAKLLTTGFWIDECGAHWLAGHLAQQFRPPYSVSNLATFHASILSLFLWGEPPWFEAVARLPSLLASAGCAAFLYFIAERYHRPGSGWIAALLFALLPNTLHHATEARPYALSQCTFAAASWALLAWRERGAAKHLAMHVAGLVVLVYLHPFFALAWPLCWLFVVATRPDLRLRYTAVLVAGATLLAPLGYVSLGAEKSIRTISYLPPPTWSQLALDAAQHRAGLAVLAALTVALLLRARRRPANATLLWWAAVALAWPLVLFAAARLTGSSAYIPRYLALSAVGFALLAAGALAMLRPTLRYGVMLAVLLLHLLPGNPARRPRDGDMRQLAAWLVAPNGGAEAPWLANSLFVEGILPSPDPPEVQVAGWAFAHVSTYPVTNPVFPMPWNFADHARPALEAYLDGPWRTQPRILAGPLRTPLPLWMQEVFRLRGYRYQAMGDLHEFTR